MRLLKCDDRGELSLTRNLDDDVAPYAILSHTWGADEEEVTFDEIRTGSGREKAGFSKIQFCEEQARNDGLEYFWVDTCCIDKANHAELSEAITSMYRWYQRATVCYVYLADVVFRPNNDDKDADDLQTVRSWKPAFRRSRWFKRGWTLQELIAPDEVIFFSKEGKRLGSKHTLEELIYEITGVPADALRGRPLSQFSVAERMRWTRERVTKKKEDQAYCLLGIFNVFMPLIYGEGANAFVRLREEINKLPRVASSPKVMAGATFDAYNQAHQEFHTGNARSLEFHKIEPIPIAATEISIQDRRRTLLASLGFGQMTSRRSTIKSAYSTTCGWFLKHPAYLSWIDSRQLHQHRGFLWINGKPGAGKSTLMKFAHAYADRTKAEGEVVIAFFFNARGDVLEKSTVGMYRALLFELLQKVTDLQDILDDSHPFSENQSQRPAWTTELLRKLLSAAVMRLRQRRLKCFIDALDECDEEQVRDMVVFFEEIGLNALETGIQLYICFASRHYPTIDICNAQKLILEDEQGHGEDLAKYVQSHLRAGKGEYIEEVRMQVWQKANGVFMWAVLVIDILNEEFRRGRIFAVKKRLQEIPAKLSDLFKDILRKDCVNMTDLLLCLQWILFAKRPLRREEFYFAMVAVLDPEPGNMTEWNPNHVTVDDMNRFVLNSSKGLAELTKSKPPTVQFIHESVRDFLIKDNGLCELWPELSNDLYGLSHDQLKRCCQNYLLVDISTYAPSDKALPKASSNSAKYLRQVLATKFPFLEYASQQLLYHADEAAQGISQNDFLRDFTLRSWVNTTNLFERYDIRRYTPEASLLYILAEKNFARLITTICCHGSTMGVQGGRFQYPLFAALANGHRDAVRALLQREGKSQIEDIVAHLEFGRAFSAPRNQTPLLWALCKGHQALAEVLAASTETDVGATDLEVRNIML